MLASACNSVPFANTLSVRGGPRTTFSSDGAMICPNVLRVLSTTVTGLSSTGTTRGTSPLNIISYFLKNDVSD